MNAEAKQVTVPEAIEAAKERFLQIAPKGLDFTAESAFAKQLLHNSDYLRNAALENPLSLQAAIINVAAIGLSLNPAKKQAYLVPRNVKQGNRWVTKIFLEPSYIGLCDIATMSGSIKWVQAKEVYASDSFVDNGLGERPTHTYEAFKPRGEMVGVYCTAKTDGGDFLTTIMDMPKIFDIRDRSESWKAYKEGRVKTPGPWGTDLEEQAKKTVVRNAYKMWPKTEALDRLALAVHLSNENEGFDPILSSPSLGQYTADQKAYFDQRITSADAVGMFLFTKSIDEAVFTNLYHSFEKGQKGKYQGIVDNLCQQGAAKLREITEAVTDRASAGDDFGIMENLEGLTPDALAYILDQCDHETSLIVRAAIDQAEAA